jgi:predicted RNase H-like nuclease
MNSNVRRVGVDGCRAGWIAVFDSGNGLSYAILDSIRELALSFPNADLICIDIPIGMPWGDHPIRPCDHLARKVLGKNRCSSVFPVPCRKALYAVSPIEARRLNKLELKRSLSAQTLGIRAKIGEVDSLLRESDRARSIFREIHPEICFWALAKCSPMIHSKATVPGKLERLNLLRRDCPDISLLLERVLAETRRKHVGEDDVLDAAVAFMTSNASKASIKMIRGDPGTDQFGLPMQMLYVSGVGRDKLPASK